jgi:Domain of unknown function (DUF4167)
MRPGQKNRMRGGRSSGSSNNSSSSRRGPNPLTRSYESNGPDVKVRGTPQHIAEKYMQLARDANSSGDNVMAEAYLQHAEHYYRIIAAAQNAQQVAYNQANGIANAADADEDEDEFEVAGSDRFTFRTPQSFQAPNGQNGVSQPFSEGGDQPAITEGQAPVEDGVQPTYQPQQQPRQDRSGQDRGERGNNERSAQERVGQERVGQERGDRQYGNRRPYEDRGDRPDRGERPQYDRSAQDRPAQDRPAGERPAQERPQHDRQDRNGRRFGRDRQFGDRNFGDRNFGDRPQGDRPAYAPRDNAVPAMDAGQEQPSIDPVNQAQPGLPSFITAPVRPVIAETSPVKSQIAPSEAAGEDAVAPQRRRRRTRLEMAADAAAADEAN